MVEVQTLASTTPSHGPVVKAPQANSEAVAIPSPSAALPQGGDARSRTQLAPDTFSPVNQDGSFEFDRVIKCGYVQRRTQKTKTWKTIYLVMRPNTLSIYKSDKEDKLRHKIYLSELTAVTLLKDPKQKRHNVFGLFSPSKNFHLQAATATEAHDWVDIIRLNARIEEEEDEIFLASPVVRGEPCRVGGFLQGSAGLSGRSAEQDAARLASSSPEPLDLQSASTARAIAGRSDGRPSLIAELSGLSGNELASHSELSDAEGQRFNDASIESLAVQSRSSVLPPDRPLLGIRSASQVSAANVEHDPDRVIWQGWLCLLRSKGGIRQWKKSWAVLRPRNFILYRNSSEYSPHLVVALSAILNVVEIDPISKTKKHCLQIITEEKRYRFCARDEDTLLHCLGAFKSLFVKRRELEARTAAVASAVAVGSETSPAVEATSPPT